VDSGLDNNGAEFTLAKKSTNSLTLANTETRRKAFIAALRNSGNVRAACNTSGISRRTAYNWKARWATFAAEWAEALEDSCDVLEAEARRRGMSVSDRLLMFLLRAHRPEVFGDKQQVDITSDGKQIGPIIFLPAVDGDSDGDG